MKLFRLTLLLTVGLLANIASAAPSSSKIPLFLKGDVRALIMNHALMIPDRAGKYAPAASGPYETREGQVFMVTARGRLTEKTLTQLKPNIAKSRETEAHFAQAKAAPQAKPRPKVTWGSSHQTGSNL